MLKILTVEIKEEIYYSSENRGLFFPEEMKKMRPKNKQEESMTYI